MATELTPMMRQYLEMKEKNKDCLLFFRLGDFYEMFNEDAKLVSKELDLTLTTRDRSKDKEDQTPMCGVPYHSAEAYIARLVAKGYKVAICEQTEDPATAKGLVDRDIVRIVTPGTVTESSMLDESRNNYMASLFGLDGAYGLCFCDLSTGAFYATGAQGPEAVARVAAELGRFAPAEVIRGGQGVTAGEIENTLFQRLRCCVDEGKEPPSLETAAGLLERHFGASLAELGVAGQEAVVLACALLLQTMQETQKNDLSHIRRLEYYTTGRYMELDLTARRNLELTETLRDKSKRGSLLWVLDQTKTAMGGRLLRSWLEKPLLDPVEIGRRQGAVEELVGNPVARGEVEACLKEISDLERVMTRIVTGSANGRDLVSLAQGCRPLPELKEQLGRLQSPMLARLRDNLDEMQDLRSLIEKTIVADPPFTIREGGLIREGADEEIDRLRDIMNGGAGTIAAIEGQEREKTGIRTLKVGYNRVFGYYIEVSKSFQAQVPAHYIRKQTLANCERYITQELKELEATVLTAKDRITALEYQLFTRLREFIAKGAGRVQETAAAVAAVDVLCSLAAVAAQRGYCRPEVTTGSEILIREGRHPVVEQVLKDSLFVPNDTELGVPGAQVAIITGPNMAGKSTYMVEMTEVAQILKHATARSLLILDEIGRGTSTFDGMAIARAVLEHVANSKKLGAKTLFATHYHELTAMEAELPNVKNYNIAVKKRGKDMIFLRKIVPGAADESYGVEVANLAGLPGSVITRARQLLQELEAGAAPAQPVEKPEADQVSMLDMSGQAVCRELQKVAVETLTPIEAMNLLFRLKQML